VRALRVARSCSLSSKPTLVISLFLVAGAGASVAGQNGQRLSDAAFENAKQQIAALSADKAKRNKAQQKLDTQLIFAARQQATGVIHPAAPKLRHSLKAESDGRIKVEIRGSVTPALLAAIQASGGTVLGSWPNYRSILAVLPLASMEGLATLPEVVFIEPPAQAVHNSCVDSEGDVTHRAIQARSMFGVTGAGISVGVLSDSINNSSNSLALAIACGNIDTNNSYVLAGQAGTGEGEGLAMCEIIHDLAPGATVWFATGDPTAEQMASNIVGLAQAGCRIICDDISYNNESPFQDQVIAQAVNTVSAMGVLYFSCARNSGNLDSLMSSTWQGNYYDGGSAGQYGEFLDFSQGTQSPPVKYNTILAGGYDFRADLFWSDPLGASTNDYDLYMLDGFGDIIYASANPQNGTQDPYEHLDDPAQLSSGYYLVVTLFSGTNRFLHLDFGRGIIDWATAGCIRGHNACDAPNAFTVAATPAAAAQQSGDPSGPYPNPFDSSDVVENFSSDGPRRMFYNPDGSAITPGDFSSTGGRVLAKPEFTAADGVSTTLPLNGGLNPFFGTSAATPHAAAIAALVLSYNPALSPAQVRSVLTNSCTDIMAPGWDRDSGFGILDALTALQNTPAPSAPAPPYFVPGTLKRTGTGQFQAMLAGTLGSKYHIQISTNLYTWSNLLTLTMTNTNSMFVDTTATASRRFYRAELVP